MTDMPRPLADDADALIKECASYMETGPMYWDAAGKLHMVYIDGALSIPLNKIDAWLAERREELIRKVIKHLFDEVGQAQYTNHATRGTYVAGCRGLLCRRANRLVTAQREGHVRNGKYAIADVILEEAEARILPEEVVGHVRYTDRVASPA